MHQEEPALVADWAAFSDDEHLQQLLRESPMPGRIRVTFERSPSFFRAAFFEGERSHTVLARQPGSGAPIAMASRSVRERFVNGQVVRLGFLSQLRISRLYLGRKRTLLRAGFDRLKLTHASDEAAFDITTVVSDNTSAQRLLTAKLPGLPVYTELEPISTVLIPVRYRIPSRKIVVRRASVDLLEEILSCLERFGCRHQFAPHWTAKNLFPEGLAIESFLAAVCDGRLVGCCAVWDQRSFKQTVVRGYDGPLERWRKLLNLLGMRLPAPGTILPLACISHLGVDNDDSDVLAALLAAAIAEARTRGNIEWLALSLAPRHPLLKVAQRFNAREYASILYAVHQPGAAPALDDRIPHVEVALL